MAAARLLAEERHLELPDDLALRIVLADRAVAFVAHQVVAGRQLPDQAGVAVRARIVDLELDLAVQLAVPIDLDDAAGAGFGDHDLAALQRLERVDFDLLALVAVHGSAVVGPDGLARLRIDLGDLRGPLLNHDVAIRQDMNVMDAAPRHLPLDLPLGIDNRQ